MSTPAGPPRPACDPRLPARQARGARMLLLAGRSVRLMAEDAHAAGLPAWAVDAYGDQDTRAASRRWDAIGAGCIAPERLLARLHEAATDPTVLGWVAGPELDTRPDLLEAADALLPRLGTPAGGLAALKDPRHFFATLDRLGLAHPAVSFTPPATPAGWLRKQAGGAGGWHIRAAGCPSPAPAAWGPVYHQQEQAGTPLSVLFLAEGDQAQLLSLQAQRVRPLGGLPHVFRGVLGPLPWPPGLQAWAQQACAALGRAFGLRGLVSLDLLQPPHGPPQVLELNARPGASLALHPGAGLMARHVQACLGRLPDAVPAPAAGPAPTLRGTELILAPAAFALNAPLAGWLAGRGDVHDLPAAGSRWAAGEPVCSLSATAADGPALESRLLQGRRTLRAAFLAGRPPDGP